MGKGSILQLDNHMQVFIVISNSLLSIYEKYTRSQECTRLQTDFTLDGLKTYSSTSLGGTEQSPMGVDTMQSPRGGQLKRQLSESGDEGEGMEVEGGGGEAPSSLTSKKQRAELPSSAGTQ